MRRALAPFFAALALLALWQAVVAVFALPPSLLPAPSLIASTLIANGPSLLASAAVTLGESAQALALAGVGGVALAVLFCWSPWLEKALLPLAIGLQVTPLIAIAPLLMIYLPPHAAVLACAFVVAFFPILSNAAAGLRATDAGLLDLFRLKRASRRQLIFQLRLPSALPQIMTGLQIGAGLSLVGAVAAELAAGASGEGEGLAFRIVEAGYRLKIPLMFAAVALLALCGVALYALMSAISALVLQRWRN